MIDTGVYLLNVVRQSVQLFLNAARTRNLALLKRIAQRLDDEGKGLATTVADIKDANQLHFVAREGKNDVCKYLLEELKHDVNTRDEDGETPILHAARQGHTETVKYLFEHGANPSIPSNLGAMTLRHSAGIACGSLEQMKGLSVALLYKMVDQSLFAMDPDPTDATLPSKRSLCWLLLLHAEKALADAKTCRALRPDWKYDEAANAFYEGVTLAPENGELIEAFSYPGKARQGKARHGKALP
ncbi:ankyrin-1-like [Mangifera indica]|uniref:ankyrin-1-like n=1 Tax=Mangifera indica TaxID=29780 RepID=UPI001CFBF899|nr:ankyrin-1-like [Mangifera indica]